MAAGFMSINSGVLVNNRKGRAESIGSAFFALGENRKNYKEAGAAPRLPINFDPPVVRGYDAVANR